MSLAPRSPTGAPAGQLRALYVRTGGLGKPSRTVGANGPIRALTLLLYPESVECL